MLNEKKEAHDNAAVSNIAEANRAKRAVLKQSKIPFASSKAPSELSEREQKKVDTSIMNYFISKAIPFTHVDDPSFIGMVHALNPKANIMGYKKLRRMILKEKEVFLTEVKDDLKNVKYVCLTADMWSSPHRAWIGMTIHWLVPNDFSRKSAPICCQRFTGL